jgi:DNA (cytosine-5)-methyltransferase 1
VLVENVPEFVEWGPLGADGQPLRSRKGDIFRAFVRGLEAIGYRVEWRVLNAADYGGATTRKRLFVQARRGNRRIAWPEPTHAARGKARALFGELREWRAAREVIDFTLPSQSIFRRKRPLAPRTLERIREGMRRFWGDAAKPFLVAMEHGGRVLSIDEPLPTITTARGGAFGLVEPFVIGQHGGAVARSVRDPLPMIATKGAVALIEPFLAVLRNNADARSLDEPLPTITAGGQHLALVEPFLVPYYGTSQPVGVDRPLPTITTKDRFGLVQQLGLDVLFRMLRPRELARGMGFPDEYVFCGTGTDVTKQIGNAVEINQAEALIRALVARRPSARPGSAGAGGVHGRTTGAVPGAHGSAAHEAGARV